MARPEKIKTELGQRLRDIRRQHGDQDRELFARPLGVSGRSLATYERGDSEPASSVLAAYRLHYGVNLEWLVTGEGGMFDEPSMIATSRPDSSFIALPFLDVVASAGHGAVVPMHESINNVVSFERAFLRNLGAIPEHCKIITARGDSMTPTIPDGSLIVVDHSQRDIVNGWISVVNVSGDLLVKRVRRRLDGNIELISDNPIYPIEAIGPDQVDQLVIIGRVVYFCRVP